MPLTTSKSTVINEKNYDQLEGGVSRSVCTGHHEDSWEISPASVVTGDTAVDRTATLEHVL